MEEPELQPPDEFDDFLEAQDGLMHIQQKMFAELVGRINALEVLVDMLWTNNFFKETNPMQAAANFKKEVLGLVRYNPDDEAETASYDSLEKRLEKIIYRVETLLESVSKVMRLGPICGRGA